MKKTIPVIDYIDNKTEHKLRLPITVFKKPENNKQYADLEKVLDKLIDEVRDNEKHPLAIVMHIIGENLEDYDTKHNPAIGHDISDIDMVKYLMKTHHLHQSDLAEIFGGQANVSKFLTGKRSLSKSQIAGLKELFSISADFFVK
jgi:HTH-type transcriptional regulator/antitoxin HigA